MDSLITDLRHALRVFFNRPGLTLLSIAALSASIGLTTNTFSSINAFFLKPLPFENADSLHIVYTYDPNGSSTPMTLPLQEVPRLAQLPQILDHTIFYNGTINLSGDGRPERYDGTFASTNFLRLLGHEPILGPGLSESGRAADGRVELLISKQVWEDRYRADPDIIGRRVRANGQDAVIAGVLGEGFHFPVNSNIWTVVDGLDESSTRGVFALIRLQANADLDLFQKSLEDALATWKEETGNQDQDFAIQSRPLGSFVINEVSAYYFTVVVLVVVLILLISCANVANLLIGRALVRGRELAIRAALGASRMRILRQLLTESFLLAAFGTVGGLLISAWAVRWTYQSSTWPIPYYIDFSLDWRVFVFAVLLMLMTTLIAGIVPAWQASRTDPNEILKDTSLTSTSFRLGKLTRLLAVVQIAFSCALLFGAGLVTRHVNLLANSEAGYPAEKILTMRMGLFPGDYPNDRDRMRFFDELVTHTSEIAGVQAAGITSWISQFGNYQATFVVNADQLTQQPDMQLAYTEVISPGYLHVLGIDAVAGRLFTSADGPESAKVAIVNEAFVTRYLGGLEPLGMTLVMPDSIESPLGSTPGMQIVGVVPTLQVSNFVVLDNPEPIVYLPYAQKPSLFMSLALRSPVDDHESLIQAVQSTILQLDPHLPVYFVKSMAAVRDDHLEPFRLTASTFLGIGIMALFLAAIGVYGMVSFNVNRQFREIGIRMALGASAKRIVHHVLRQGLVQVLLGLAAGTGLAVLIGQLARNFLIGTHPLEPVVYLGVLLILVATAVVAFFIPARRAAKLSPMEALRHE